MKREYKNQLIIGVVSLVLISIIVWGYPIVQAVSAVRESEPPMISASESGIQFKIPANWVRTGQGNSSSYMTETSEDFDNVLSIDIIKPLSSNALDIQSTLDKQVEIIYQGESLQQSILFSDPIKEEIKIDGSPATMYSYYLVDDFEDDFEDDPQNPASLYYCIDVLFEHDGRIYNLLFWDDKWTSDRNWPAWLEKLFPKLTVEGGLESRANTILQSIKLD